MKRSYLAIGLIFLVLLIDQSLKMWVKLNMEMGEHFNVFGLEQKWFQIFFTENPGMAFGVQFGGDYGKLLLSLFRILAVSFITYYLYILIKKKKSYGLIASIALIWAGAVGNILDSAFYGVLFTNSHPAGGVADWATSGNGYANILYGHVVDMLYFPLLEGYYPDWVPLLGGTHFQFFQPIFNIADASISIGVFTIVLFYKRFFKNLSNNKMATVATVHSNEEVRNVLTPNLEDSTKSINSALLNDDIGSEGIDIPLDE